MAARSTCIKCGNTQFELKENAPKGSDYTLMFVQCASCGGVVGAMDYFNISTLLKLLADKLGVQI